MTPFVGQVQVPFKFSRSHSVCYFWSNTSLYSFLLCWCKDKHPSFLSFSSSLGRGNQPFCEKLYNFKVCTKFESGQGIGQPNGVATGPGLTIPKEKLRLAYTMEFYIKIIYPLIFIIFNISYWSYYLLYASS